MKKSLKKKKKKNYILSNCVNVKIVAKDRGIIFPVCQPGKLWKPWLKAYKFMLSNSDTNFLQVPTSQLLH